MKIYRYFPIFYLIFICNSLHGQVLFEVDNSFITYKGIVVDSTTKEPLRGAVISVVTMLGENKTVKSHITNKEGQFSFWQNVGSTRRIEIAYLGYKVYKQILPQDQPDIDLGIIKMAPDVYDIDEVVVFSRLKMYEMRGDTMVMFPAAIKTMQGDNLLDMLKLVPGIEVTDEGNVLIGGKLVERTKINGKLLFAEDAVTPLKVIDAKAASQLLAYDVVDERDAAVHGKNARKFKEINVITFDDFDTYAAGNVNQEGGTDRKEDAESHRQWRYMATGKVGYYREGQQWELGGGIDNRNLIDPYYGSKPSGYNRNWNLEGKISGQPKQNKSYSVSYKYDNEYHNSLLGLSSMIYFPTADFVSQITESSNISNNHKGTYAVDSWYNYYDGKGFSLRVSLVGNFSNSDGSSSFLSQTFKDNNLITLQERIGNSDGKSYKINPNIFMGKRLGANSALDFSMSANIQQNKGGSFRNDTTHSIGLDERKVLTIDSKNSYVNITPGLRYDINLGDRSRLLVSSNVNYENSSSYIVAFDTITRLVNQSVSGDYLSNQTRLKEGIRYEIWTEKDGKNYPFKNHEFTIEFDYSGVFINRDDRLPDLGETRRDFHAILPSLSYTFTPKMEHSLSFSFYESHDVPSNSSFSLRINDYNPMFITTGNPKLKDSKNYYINITSYNTFKNEQSLNFGISAGINQNNIVYTRTYYANSTVLPDHDNYEVPAGATVSMPVNGDSYMRINPSIGYKATIKPIKSIFSSNLGYTFSDPQAGIDDRLVRTIEHSGDLSLGLTTNFSARFRLELFSNTRYRWFKNSSDILDRGFWERAGAKFRWDFLGRAYLTGSYLYESYKANPSYGSDYENHILNASVGCRIFKNRKGIISLNAYDILDQTKSIMTSVNDQYITNTYSQLFTSFYTVGFEYRFGQGR